MEAIIDKGIQDIIYQVSAIVISTVTTMLGMYIKNLLKTNRTVQEYNLYNERVERVLDNALAYADSKAKSLAHRKISHIELCSEYMDRMAPDIVEKEGEKLPMMLERKRQQKRS